MVHNLNKNLEAELKKFKSSIPEKLRILESEIRETYINKNFKLDFEDKTVLVIGEFFLSILEAEKEKEITKLIEAYFGELWIHHFGGEWSINDSKKDTMYLRPIILENRKNAIRKCPYESIILFKEERKKSSFLDNINYSKEMNKKLDKARDILNR